MEIVNNQIARQKRPLQHAVMHTRLISRDLQGFTTTIGSAIAKVVEAERAALGGCANSDTGISKF